ncbi:MAG: preprotein translocase subunit SecY [Lachnospiraceae bacterium]|jgi:preprotein translocase subunit SecY|nr:preprotein translocase subunit SecY [Lachnospiraceae bacterium]
MLTTLKNAFKVKDIRQRILFTFLMLVVIRVASQIPVPGVNREYFSSWFAAQTGDAFDLFNAFTGGSFLNMSIIALNITPYITSSIIIQLLTIAIPKLEEMQRDGEEGRKKLVAITRYVTVVLSIIESGAMAIGFGRQGLLETYDGFHVFTVITALTAGSAFLMWIGERITEKGIGNGISIVLTINIISRLPAEMNALMKQFVLSQNNIAKGVVVAIIIFTIIVAMIVMVILLNAAVRKIPVQYAKKVQGRKMMGGNAQTIPLKVNTSGVIPVIFASSILQTPLIICSLLGVDGGTSFWGKVLKGLSSSNWCKPSEPIYSIGLLVYVLLVIFFAYFYTSITFNPIEVAENMKKQGGFIPGIRPGKPTSDYLTKILNYIIFIGACGLTIVCVAPFFFSGVFGANVSFGGTSLIIIVSVIVETLKQVESRMLVRNYKGFLND